MTGIPQTADPKGVAPPPAPRRGPLGSRTIPIGRLWGIEIGLDWSWLIIFALVTAGLSSQLGADHEDWSPAAAWSGGLVGSLIFFLSILLHELGHSVTSNRLGLPVRSITLFLFGGMASLSENPRSPREQLLVGIAGPIVSIVLGGTFLAAGSLLPEAPLAAEVLGAVFTWLGTVNLALAAFNMFPGHPLDGGHVLKAIVWSVTGDERQGTRVASAMGTAFAFVLMGAGAFTVLILRSFGGFWLVLIGWFLMRASQGTAMHALLEERLSLVRAGDALAETCPVVDPDETLDRLIEDAVLRKGRRHFCVQEDGELVGLVTLGEIRSVPPGERAGTRVSDVMVPRTHLATIGADETLWDAMRRMNELEIHQLPVIDGDRLAGILTREQVLRVIQNQTEIGRDRLQGPRPSA